MQSGNDAAAALAERIGTSETNFVDRFMNPMAAALSMKESHFLDPTGLPEEGMYTTAWDMATLALHTINDHPAIFPYYKLKTFTHNHITQKNRNRLLFIDPSVDGLKTGHSEEAGYHLVATAKRGNMRLLSVVMGAASDKDRVRESMLLLNYGFRYFRTYRLLSPNSEVRKARLYKGKQPQLSVGTSKVVYVTVPLDGGSALERIVQLKQPLIAPIQKGDVVGTLTIKLGEEVLGEQPLVAMETIQKGNFFIRLLDTIRLWWRSLW